MMNFVIKRDGRRVAYDKDKIYNAIKKAFLEVKGHYSSQEIDEMIEEYIEPEVKERELSVEEIQDIVENALIDADCVDVAKAYIRYRNKREIIRESNNTFRGILELVDMKNEELDVENSNKNPIVASTQRDYMAGEVSKELAFNFILPQKVKDAHFSGEIHFHDADYFSQHIFNCCLVNLEDMLQNGTVINKTLIEKPHSFATACNIATQIMAIVASSQYGGQSVSLTHLAPFVDVSRQKIKKEVEEEIKLIETPLSNSEDIINKLVEKRVKDEIKRGVQTIQYQINTLNTSNGQTPFVTIFMYLSEAKNSQEKKDLALIIEEVLEQRIQGVKNEKGVWITPTFPKLIYVLEEDNIHEDSEYWYLTKLAAKCTAKRMVPDYISEKIMKQLKGGNCYPVMGCRSALTVYEDENGPKFYGRFNQGVVTINLPFTACKSKSLDDFWTNLDDTLDICHLALQERHKRLEGTVSDISPTHFQYGAISRLEKGETIDELLHNNYSTISLGYAGLWECVYKLIGKKLIEPEGRELGLKILQYLNDKCAEWREKETIGYSLYGTPLESTTYKFAKALQENFGIIEGVSDKDFITNSYHIHVTEPIDAFTKLGFESEFQALSPGGAISYVEVPNMQNNIEAVLDVMKFIYDHIMYAELNTKSDYCQKCGFDGEIKIVEDEETGQLVWECPNCGNRDQNTMNVIRRTCGYLGSNYWNQGRTQEILLRTLHL